MDYLLGLCWNLGFDPLGGPNSEKQIKLWFFSSIVGIWAEFIDQGFFLSLRLSQGVKDEFNGSIICGCMSCTFLYQEINLQNMLFSHCLGLHRYSLLWDHTSWSGRHWFESSLGAKSYLLKEKKPLDLVTWPINATGVAKLNVFLGHSS